MIFQQHKIIQETGNGVSQKHRHRVAVVRADSILQDHSRFLHGKYRLNEGCVQQIQRDVSGTRPLWKEDCCNRRHEGKAWNARDRTHTKGNVDKRIKEMREKVDMNLKYMDENDRKNVIAGLILTPVHVVTVLTVVRSGCLENDT